MTEIILTSDQSQALAAATDGVVIADQQGNVVARLPARLSDEDAAMVAEAKRRLASDQPRRPFREVIERLKQQEES